MLKTFIFEITKDFKYLGIPLKDQKIKKGIIIGEKGLMLKKSLTNKVLTSTYDEEVDLLLDDVQYNIMKIAIKKEIGD